MPYREIADSGGVEYKITKGKIKLRLPNGRVVEDKIPRESRKWGPEQTAALMAIRLLVTDLDYDEATGSGQAEYRVEREEGIPNPGGGREQDYKAVLGWAGATLQGGGITSRRAAEIFLNDLPSGVRASFELEGGGHERKSYILGRIEAAISGIFPGSAAARRRADKRKNKNW